MLSLLERLEQGLDAVTRPVVFIAMAALIGVISLQIVSRVAFTAVGWTEEVARFLLVWITFLAATLAYRSGRHIAVTFVVDALPGVSGKGARLCAHLCVLVFLVALAIIGWNYMQLQSFQKSASLRLSMTWVYAVMPLTAVLMAWTTLVAILNEIAGRTTAHHGGDA